MVKQKTFAMEKRFDHWPPHWTEADEVINFQPNGKTWHALQCAKRWLYEHGYMHGSLDRGSFVACVKDRKYDLPQKLHNFNSNDIQQIDAVIFSTDYREGEVEVWIFKK